MIMMFKIFKKKRNDKTTNHLIHLLIEQTLAHKLKKECFQNPDLWEKYNALLVKKDKKDKP